MFGPPQSKFLSVRMVKTPSCIQLELKMKSLLQRVFYACQTIRNHPGNFEKVPMRTWVQVEDIWSICCELILDKL